MSTGAIPKTCVICRRAFVDPKHPAAQACSKACAGQLSWRNRVARGERPGRNRPTGTCPACGKTFESKSYAKTTFCSLKCAAQGRRGPSRTGATDRRRPKWTEFVKLDAIPTGHSTSQGYLRVYLPEHPRASTKGGFLQHRLVMEQHLGRFLDPEETIHHRNGVKHDNRIDNLQLVTIAQPNGTVLCPHCRREFLVH